MKIEVPTLHTLPVQTTMV